MLKIKNLLSIVFRKGAIFFGSSTVQTLGSIIIVELLMRTLKPKIKDDLASYMSEKANGIKAISHARLK